MRDYVKRLLSQQYEVESVADGLAALDSARGRVPDLVLTDVMMPGLDGFGLLQELRAICNEKSSHHSAVGAGRGRGNGWKG